MRSVDELLKKNNLADPDDIDALLDLAEITRQAISTERYHDIELLIDYTVRNDCFEAFSWIMAALQEEYDKADNCRLKECPPMRFIKTGAFRRWKGTFPL